MALTALTQQTTLQVHDTEGQVYSVRIGVDEKTAQGTLVITGSAAEKTRQYELTQMQKSQDGKTLGFKASGATVTLTIEGTYTPPRLHLVARVFVPVVDTTYTLSETEQEGFIAWINTLSLGVLSKAISAKEHPTWCSWCQISAPGLPPAGGSAKRAAPTQWRKAGWRGKPRPTLRASVPRPAPLPPTSPPPAGGRESLGTSFLEIA